MSAARTIELDGLPIGAALNPRVTVHLEGVAHVQIADDAGIVAVLSSPERMRELAVALAECADAREAADRAKRGRAVTVRQAARDNARALETLAALQRAVKRRGGSRK